MEKLLIDLGKKALPAIIVAVISYYERIKQGKRR